jgi:hypothetical protein
VPDSLALQAHISSDNLNVCLSVHYKSASDVLSIAQTFYEGFRYFPNFVLHGAMVHVLLHVITCTVFLATIFLKLTVEQQHVQLNSSSTCSSTVVRAAQQ